MPVTLEIGRKIKLHLPGSCVLMALPRPQGHFVVKHGGLVDNVSGTGRGWQQSRSNWTLLAVVGHWVRVHVAKQLVTTSLLMSCSPGPAACFAPIPDYVQVMKASPPIFEWWKGAIKLCNSCHKHLCCISRQYCWWDIFCAPPNSCICAANRKTESVKHLCCYGKQFCWWNIFVLLQILADAKQTEKLGVCSTCAAMASNVAEGVVLCSPKF